MTPESILLLGEQYTTLGVLAVAALSGGGAVSLSRGAHPKSYHHVDPNEDAALVARDTNGSLLAVADGHNGTAASHRALAEIERRTAELIASQEDFEQTFENVATDIAHALAAVEPSRTCLILAVLSGQTCRWACLGDCMLFRSGQPDPVSIPNNIILRPSLHALPRPAELWSGGFDCARQERIALVSDGITNFVPDLAAIAAILGRARNDDAAVRELARTAMRGGAGDNVAAASITLA